MVTKVFYEWWGRSTLTIGNKVLVIQKAFGHMGKPAVFDRLMSQCPDLTILLEYAKTGVYSSFACWKWSNKLKGEA